MFCIKIKDFVDKLGMDCLTPDLTLQREISKIYVCDLLSWVMSHAGSNDAWVTVQTHVNIVAVAVLLEVPCIIIPEGLKVEEATIKKALDENIAILSTKMDAYEICWRSHEILC